MQPNHNPGAHERALEELRADPYRSDRIVAAAAGCSHTTVQLARQRAGLAPAPAERVPRPWRGRTSKIRPLVLAGWRTSEIMAELGVSFSAVCYIRRQLAPRPADVAVAVDEFHVTRIVASQQAASRRQGTPGSKWPAPWKPGKAFHQEPRILPTPPQPDLRRGNCTRPGVDPEWWAEHASRADRQAALANCASCPVLEPCREWALSLPASAAGVIGGLTPAARDRARRGG